MIKSILFLVVLSVLAVLFQDQLIGVLHGILVVHQQIAKGFGTIFSHEGAGEVVQSVLALLLIPFAIGVCFAIAYFFIRKHHFPYTINVIWVCWAVLVTAMLSQTGHVTNQTAEEIKSEHKIAQALKNQQLAEESGKLTPGEDNSSTQAEQAADGPGGAPMDATPASA